MAKPRTNATKKSNEKSDEKPIGKTATNPTEPKAPANPFAKSNPKQSGKSKEVFFDLEKTSAIVKKNWLVLRTDNTRLVAMLIFPVLMLVIFGYTSGVTPKHLPAALADYDQTLQSHSVAKQLEALPVLSIAHHVGTESEGRKLLDDGQIKALIVIPSGFGKDLAEQKQAHVTVMVDESDPTVAQIAKSSVAVFVQKLSRQLSLQQVTALQTQARLEQARLAQSRLLLGSILDGNSAVQFQTATTALAYSKSSLSQSIQTIQTSQQGLTQSLSTPASSDYLNQVPALPSGADSAAIVAALARQQQTQNQIASLGVLSLYSQKAIGQIVLTQTALGQLQSLEAAQKTETQAASAQMDRAGKFLTGFSNRNAASLADPLVLEEKPVYGQNRQGIDFLLPSILALIIFQGATMAMGRAIAGERKDGSMTRVFLTPTSNTTIVLGTQVFYMIFESVRSAFIVLLAIALFGVHISGNVLEALFIIVLFAAGSVGVGMFLSSLAKSEEQYQPLAMLVGLPTMFLAGVFFPIQTMPAPLQALANIIPLHYAADALRGVMIKGFSLTQVLPDLVAMFVFFLITLAASLAVFKRELV